MISNKYIYFLILVITSYTAQTSYNNKKTIIINGWLNNTTKEFIPFDEDKKIENSVKQLAHCDRILNQKSYLEKIKKDILLNNHDLAITLKENKVTLSEIFFTKMYSLYLHEHQNAILFSYENGAWIQKNSSTEIVNQTPIATPCPDTETFTFSPSPIIDGGK